MRFILIACGVITYFPLALVASAASIDNYSAKLAAAEADISILTDFLEDFEKNFEKYIDYMDSEDMQLPQAIADYYEHLTSITGLDELISDLATSFPFTDFETFITAFPWYTSLLSDVSDATFYLPEDFLTSVVDSHDSSTESITDVIEGSQISEVLSSLAAIFSQAVNTISDSISTTGVTISVSPSSSASLPVPSSNSESLSSEISSSESDASSSSFPEMSTSTSDTSLSSSFFTDTTSNNIGTRPEIYLPMFVFSILFYFL